MNGLVLHPVHFSLVNISEHTSVNEGQKDHVFQDLSESSYMSRIFKYSITSGNKGLYNHSFYFITETN